MKLGRVRQALVVLMGLLYTALLYPLLSDLWHSHWLVGMNGNECEPMFLSFFVGLGLFLLLAARNPSAHRSLIIFAAFSSLFHAFVMAIETVESFSHGVHRDYGDVVIAAIFGAILLVAIPREPGSVPSLPASAPRM
jgi:hypothetical protein